MCTLISVVKCDLSREGINCSIIDLKVLSGNIQQN